MNDGERIRFARARRRVAARRHARAPDQRRLPRVARPRVPRPSVPARRALAARVRGRRRGERPASSRSAPRPRTSAGCTASSWCATASRPGSRRRRASCGRCRTSSRRCAIPPTTGELPDAEILAVVTDADAASKGWGSLVLHETLAELERRGCASAKVVAGASNEAALRLYERCGFAPLQQISIHDDVRVGSVGMGLVVAFGAALARRARRHARRPARVVRARRRSTGPDRSRCSASRSPYLGGVAVFVALARGARADASGVARPARAGGRARTRRRRPRASRRRCASGHAGARSACVAGLVEPTPGRFGWSAPLSSSSCSSTP